MNDPRLSLLSDALVPVGVVGVSVPDWNDKTTWLIWHEGSSATQATTDAKAGPIVAAFDVNAAVSQVPQSVTPRQARLALNAAGLLDQVNATVNATGGATLITWEYATVINRTDPLITTLGTALNLSSAVIDQLFKTAATL